MRAKCNLLKFYTYNRIHCVMGESGRPREAHNFKVTGSNPVHATKIKDICLAQGLSITELGEGRWFESTSRYKMGI